MLHSFSYTEKASGGMLLHPAISQVRRQV
jgi:hypothetical protein